MSLKAWIRCVLLFSACVATPCFSQERKKDDSDSKAATVGLPFTTDLTSVPCYRDITLKALVKHYGDWREWKALQEDTKNLLASCSEGTNKAITPTEDQPVLFTVVDDEVAYSWVVPQADDYGQSLKGVESVRVVVVTEYGRKIEKPFRVTITSTKVENPFVSQIPDFVKAVTGALLDTSHKAHLSMVNPKPTPTLSAWVSGPVPLPFRRATVVEDGTMNAPASKDQPPKKGADINATYNNAPWAHWGLTGVAGALVGRIRGPEQMKVDNGKYASDPLSRALTMAAVSYYPWSFDTSSPEMTWRERLSVLGGGVLTPAPGFGIGISGGIIRGLAINVGWAWMWVPTSDNGAVSGSAVPGTGRQLSNKRNSAFFLGGGYVFTSK